MLRLFFKPATGGIVVVSLSLGVGRSPSETAGIRIDGEPIVLKTVDVVAVNLGPADTKPAGSGLVEGDSTAASLANTGVCAVSAGSTSPLLVGLPDAVVARAGLLGSSSVTFDWEIVMLCSN